MLSTVSTYILPISLGSPAITYPLQLDLGSSDLLIASTLCGDDCPKSLGPSVNPYYDTSRSSSTFLPVNGNQTIWHSGFADGSLAGGFIAREKVQLGNVSIDGQVFGTPLL
jgi:hypothetical protein